MHVHNCFADRHQATCHWYSSSAVMTFLVKFAAGPKKCPKKKNHMILDRRTLSHSVATRPQSLLVLRPSFCLFESFIKDHILTVKPPHVYIRFASLATSMQNSGHRNLALTRAWHIQSGT